MAMEDILGFGKASEKLLDILSETCGTLYRPTKIRREASARAEEIRLLGRASAETEAEKIRILGLANTEARLLDSNIDVEILERAKARLVTREIQRQANFESIAEIAFNELPENVSENPVDKNWRTRFFNIAEDIDDKDMQLLWGKILAGEVASPGRYSIRTLEALKNLSKNEAELFQRLCGLSFDSGIIAQLEDTRTPDDRKFFIPNSPTCDFIDFGVNYDEILILRAAGLVVYGDRIESVLHKNMKANPNCDRNRRIMLNNGISVCFDFTGESIEIPSVVMTQAGRELMSLIPPSPNLPYLRRVAAGLKVRGVEMYRVDFVEEPTHTEQRTEF